MKKMDVLREKFKVIAISVMICLTWSGIVSAADGELSYDKSPDQLILAYHVSLDELVERDTTPRVRIYGDGKVIVHYSKVYRKAGDYSLILTENEIEEILQLISESGILNFDSKGIDRSKKAYDTLVASRQILSPQPQTFSTIMDKSTTQVFYNVRGGSTAAGKSIDSAVQSGQISYSGLQDDLIRYPEVLEIQGLANVEIWFEALIKRPNLQKITGAL